MTICYRLNDIFRMYSAPIPPQSNDPNTTQTYSVYIPLLLCVALWWNRHGIHAEYVIQSIANSHGLLYLYPLAVMIISHHISDLFIPGIFTPSRRVSFQLFAANS